MVSGLGYGQEVAVDLGSTIHLQYQRRENVTTIHYYLIRVPGLRRAK